MGPELKSSHYSKFPRFLYLPFRMGQILRAYISSNSCDTLLPSLGKWKCPAAPTHLISSFWHRLESSPGDSIMKTVLTIPCDTCGWPSALRKRETLRSSWWTIRIANNNYLVFRKVHQPWPHIMHSIKPKDIHGKKKTIKLQEEKFL